MRCFKALGNWQRLADLASAMWPRLQAASEQGMASALQSARFEVASLGARAAWAMGQWSSMAQFAKHTDESTTQAWFLRAVVAVH